MHSKLRQAVHIRPVHFVLAVKCRPKKHISRGSQLDAPQLQRPLMAKIGGRRGTNAGSPKIRACKGKWAEGKTFFCEFRRIWLNKARLNLFGAFFARDPKKAIIIHYLLRSPPLPWGRFITLHVRLGQGCSHTG